MNTINYITNDPGTQVFSTGCGAFVNADHVISRTYSAVEGAEVIIDGIEQEFFCSDRPTKEDLETLTGDYVRIGKLLRAALELLHVAEVENQKWQSRPAERVKG